MEMVLGLAASFLGGCLVTAFGFVLPIQGKISRMDVKIDALTEKLDAHIKTEQQPCQYHTRIEKSIAVLESRGGAR